MDVTTYTTDELAARLHVSPRTLARWRTQGRGPRAYDLGRHKVYLASTVMEWLEAQPADRGTRRYPHQFHSNAVDTAQS